MVLSDGNRRVIQTSLLVTIILILVALIVKLIWPFIHALAWSVVTALVTWPIHRRIVQYTKLSRATTALLTTSLLTLTFILAILPLTLELILEAKTAINAIDSVESTAIHELLLKVPALSPIFIKASSFLRDEGLVNYIIEHQKEALAIIGSGVKEISQVVFTFFLVIFFTFFLFRDGLTIGHECKSLTLHLAGRNGLKFIATATDTLRGAVYGTIFTAIAQGLIAALGYSIFGVPTPILFGLVTMLFSFIPFGGPMVYLPLSAYLIFTGESWHQGALLVVWGIAFVSTADNILRPYFISQATQISLVTVVIGIVGGALQFGMIGIFLGPALLAVARSIWLTYVEAINLQAT